jgi:hypothetical protein
MPKKQFDRTEMAHWYAARHLKTDPGIEVVYFLPTGAPDREIRFVEINNLIAVRDKDPLEPIDFGVDVGGASAHKLLVVDVTPAQWEKINKKNFYCQRVGPWTGRPLFPGEDMSDYQRLCLELDVMPCEMQFKLKKFKNDKNLARAMQ